MATASAQTTSTTTQERLNASENITGENRSGLAPQQAPSGFIFLNGNVYVVSGGRATPLTREMSFRVTPLGFVGFNGAPQNIPSGSMLSMDGQLTAAPNNLVDGTGNTIVLPPFNQQGGGLNGGFNASGNINTQGNNNGASQNQTNPQQQNGTNMQNGVNNQNGTNTNGTNQNGVRNGSNGQSSGTGTTPINPPANGGTPTTPSANGATPTTPSANGATPRTPPSSGGTGSGTSGSSSGGTSSGGTSGGSGGAKGK